MNKRTKRRRRSRFQKPIVIFFLAAMAFLITVIILITTNSLAPRSERPEMPVVAATTQPELKFGEFISLTANKVYKAKIEPSYNNEQTIAQNYYNAIYLIEERGRTEPFEYWAVADMTDGSERKVIAFTVGEDAIRIVKEGTVYGSLIEAPNGVTYDFADLVSDLWILPSLLQ